MATTGLQYGISYGLEGLKLGLQHLDSDASPVAAFSSSLTGGFVVNFVDQSTDDVQVTSWAWDFGDGTTSTSQNPQKTYSTSGSYYVSLTASDGGSRSHITAANVTVVNVDGPNNVIVPQGATESTLLGLPVFDYMWLCQDASGSDMVQARGGLDLTKVGASGSWQQTITSWTRKGLGTVADPEPAIWRTTSGSGPTLSVQSVTWVGLFKMDSLPAAARFFYEAGTTAPALRTRILTTGRLSLRVNATDFDGTYNYVDGAVHPFVIYYDRTNSQSMLITDKEAVSGTFDASVVEGTFKGIGSATSAPDFACLWLAAATGSNAERDWKAYLRNTRWPLAY